MNTRTRTRLIAAIAAALPLVAFSLPADAQQRVNQDGRAHDANTRVGGDGSNERSNAIDRRGQTYTGNQLVTGNVSGARAFRGPLGYSDPNEFSGPVGGIQTDRFIRDSSGAPTRTNAMTDYGRPTAFYNDKRSTPPPSGFTAQGFSGGYYRTGESQTTVGGGSPYFQSTSQVFTSQTSMLRPGGLLLEGGRDQQNRQTMLSVSPLYGVVPLNTGPLGDVNDTMQSRTDTLNPRMRLTPDDLARMRRELSDPSFQPEPGADQRRQQQQGTAEEQPDPSNLAQPLKSDALNSSLKSTALDVPPAERGPGGAGAEAQTSQGLDRRIVVAPEKQSKQYAELQKRLLRQQQESGEPMSAEEANRQFRQLKRAQEAEAAEAPDGEKPGERGGLNRPPAEGPRRPVLPPTRRKAADDAAAPAPEQPIEPAAPAPAPGEAAVERPEPLKIKSLAEGVEAKGLHDVLVDAEKLMRDGKFTSAIEKYAAAEQVAPNNPLIRLGRAHAELGATRYGSAEQHLREAFTGDPALLLGQYDLDSFIGRERLSFLVKDLKQVADSEATSARPKLLLAYIAYNTPGLESAASGYLDEAAQRSKRPDSLINAMRKHWSLPAATDAAPPEQNK